MRGLFAHSRIPALQVRYTDFVVNQLHAAILLLVPTNWSYIPVDMICIVQYFTANLLTIVPQTISRTVKLVSHAGMIHYLVPSATKHPLIFFLF